MSDPVGDSHNDRDNDHSFIPLSVHKAQTRPDGQSAWAVAAPWLAKGHSLRAQK